MPSTAPAYCALFLGLCVCVLLSSSACAHARVPDLSVSVRMRDGVEIHTEIFLSIHALQKSATVLVRTPYGASNYGGQCEMYLKLGFHCLAQDMRGRFKSGGSYSFWRYDSFDAYDTMEWIKKQSWSNGVVFDYGFSADGIAAYVQASVEPMGMVGLRSQFVGAGSGNMHKTSYQGGALRFSMIDGWLAGIGEAAFALEVAAAEPLSAWWTSIIIENSWNLVTWPAVHWTGWYDIFNQQQLDVFDGFQEHSTLGAGNNYLVVDPFGHCIGGAVHMPQNRTQLMFALMEEMFKALANLSEEEYYAKLSEPQVDLSLLGGVPQKMTMYVMGPDASSGQDVKGNFWTSVPTWPSSTPLKLYLGTNGTLTKSPPSSSSTATTFVFDPNHPVPTLGGNNLLLPKCGPQDQRELESRPDVLTFTSEPFTDYQAITGRLWVNLAVSSNCTDTDFTVKVTDVYPDGTSMLIQDGIQRMRWRDDPSSATLMVPGQVYNIQVDVWSTSYIFNPGHRVRVDVSSSNYPRFSVNRNNGQSVVQGGPMLVAENSVHLGDASFLTLPLVDLADLPPFNPDNVLQSVDPERRSMWQDAFDKNLNRFQSSQ